MRTIGTSRRSLLEATYFLLSFDEHQDDSNVVDLLCQYTPPDFRSAVRQSSRFLYRGEEILRPSILHPAPDLLMEGTYTDDSALEYFRCLEKKLKSRAKPSTGHIGTANYNDAAEWGGVVSVWPLGNHLSYTYPRNSNLFFPGDCSSDELIMDHNLVTGLSAGREVLFASWFDEEVKDLPPEMSPSWISAFLAIPSSEDDKLKSDLERRNYGL